MEKIQKTEHKHDIYIEEVWLDSSHYVVGAAKIACRDERCDFSDWVELEQVLGG